MSNMDRARIIEEAYAASSFYNSDGDDSDSDSDSDSDKSHHNAGANGMASAHEAIQRNKQLRDRGLPTPPAKNKALQKLKAWHHELANWLLQNPRGTLIEAAQRFDTSPQYLSHILNTHAFKEYLSERLHEHQERVSDRLISKAQGVVEEGLDQITEKLNTQREASEAGNAPVMTLAQIQSVTEAAARILTGVNAQKRSGGNGSGDGRFTGPGIGGVNINFNNGNGDVEMSVDNGRGGSAVIKTRTSRDAISNARAAFMNLAQKNGEVNDKRRETAIDTRVISADEKTKAIDYENAEDVEELVDQDQDRDRDRDRENESVRTTSHLSEDADGRTGTLPDD